MHFQDLAQSISPSGTPESRLKELIRTIDTVVHAIMIVEEDSDVRNDYRRKLNALRHQIRQEILIFEEGSDPDLSKLHGTFTQISARKDDVVNEYKSKSSDANKYVRTFSEIWTREPALDPTLLSGQQGTSASVEAPNQQPRRRPPPIDIPARDLVVRGIYEIIRSPQSTQEADKIKMNEYLMKALPPINKSLPPTPHEASSPSAAIGSETIGRRRILSWAASDFDSDDQSSVYPASSVSSTRISISSAISDPLGSPF